MLVLKDAAGNPGETAALVSSAPAGYEVYSGDDAHDAAPAGHAGRSASSGSPPTGPGRTTRTCSTSGRRVTWSAPAWSTPGCWRASPSRPATTPRTRCPPRRMLRVLGLPVGEARLPMGPAPAGLEDRAREVLANLDRWRDAFPGRPDRQPGPPDARPHLHRLPRRAGRDRSQLHGARAGRPPAPHRLRAHVPRRRHARHRPRAARLHLPAGQRRRGSWDASPPTATRTTSALLSFLLRELSFPIYGSALTLGLARNRIEEAGLLDQTRLWRRWPTASGGRSGPFDVEFIPVTHSVPHAFAIAVHTPQGVVLHSGDFKLDLTPVDGRRTDLARIGAIAASEGIRLLMSDSTNARGARVRAERARGRRGAAGAVRRAARPAHHHLQLRQPHPPHPADRRCRHRQRPGGRHAWAVHQEERPPGPRPGPADHPGRVAHRHRGGRSPGAGAGVHHLHRLPGRADVGARAHGVRRQPLAEGRRARHGHPLQPRHPGQRVQRQPGDRRAAAHRGRGRPQRRGRRARHGPRAGR